MKKLVLIDGNALIFRAFYATAIRMTRSVDQTPTNALYLFASIILKLIENHDFDEMIVALDSPGKKIRHQAFDDYKANRKQIPDELKLQFPLIKEFLSLTNIETIEIEGYEADDILGSLACKAQKEGWLVQIFTGDRDLLQLIDDHIQIHMMRKGLSEVEVFDANHLDEVYHIHPKQIIDVKALMGDASDNIPGVKGIGEKTAFDLIIRFGSVQEVYQHVDELKGKLKEKLIEGKESALLSYQLATIDTHMQIDFDLQDAKYESYDPVALHEFFKKYDIKSLMKYTKESQASYFSCEVSIVQKVSPSLLQPHAMIYIDFDGDNYHYKDLRGVAISTGNRCEYISKDCLLFDFDFIDYLQNKAIEKSVYDIKKSCILLEKLNIFPQGFSFDILLANYLLNQNINEDVQTLLSMYQISLTPLNKQATFEEIASYAGSIASACFSIQEEVERRIQQIDNEKLLYEVEQPLALILKKMEQFGVLVDVQLLDTLSKEYEQKINLLEQEIHHLANNDDLNINSSKQLADLLYRQLQLPCNKKMSTSADDLIKIQDLHPIVPKILEYRKYTKLLNTYIDAFYTYKDEHHRIHALFNQSSTMTGRLSSSQPNMQNLSVRDDSRMIIRKLIIAQERYALISLDYSQIELRLLALLSQDETMIQAFKNHEDVHAITASKVYRVPLNEVSKEQRHIAKAINFGIVYGMSPWGLSEQIGVDLAIAKQFIETFFETYPKVKAYLDQNIAFCKENGYVTTLLKRRRIVPEIHSQVYQVREFGKRVAMNTPIQGSAADIIKLAMIAVDTYLCNRNQDAFLTCQIHDELLLEVKEEVAEKVAQDIQKIMENILDQKMPLEVHYSIGKNWLEAK